MTGARSRRHDTAGVYDEDPERAPVPIEHDDVDRRPHADRVHRSGVGEHERFARADAIAPQEPPPPFRAGLGERDQPTVDHAHMHRVTVAASTDTSVLDDVAEEDRLGRHAVGEELLEVIREADRIHDLDERPQVGDR